MIITFYFTNVWFPRKAESLFFTSLLNRCLEYLDCQVSFKCSSAQVPWLPECLSSLRVLQCLMCSIAQVSKCLECPSVQVSFQCPRASSTQAKKCREGSIALGVPLECSWNALWVPFEYPSCLWETLECPLCFRVPFECYSSKKVLLHY